MRYWHLSKIGLINRKVQLMLDPKFQPNMLSGSRGKFDFSGLATLAIAAILIPDQPKFNHSEALQPCHAAREI